MKRLSRLRDIRILAAGLLSLLLVFFVVLHGQRGTPASGRTAPAGIVVSPQGDAVARLAPVSVRFRSEPEERDGATLLQIEPPVKGSYVWQDSRTLVFQPAFPGLLRGQKYLVNVQSHQQDDLFQPFFFGFTTADSLSVDSVIPAPDDVEVPANAQVLVQFSRSVAPLTTLAEQLTNQVVLFDPPLKGTGEWLNTSLYRFTPDPVAVAPFTKYILRVPAKLSQEPDGALKQDYVWSYTTFGPALQTVTPAANTKFAAPSQPVSLRFNQPMDRASVEAGVRLTQAWQGTPVTGTYVWADNDTAVTFTPNQRLAPLMRHELVVAKGLKGVAGGETRVEWRSAFETIGVPKVARTTPGNGETAAQRYGISIVFSNPMNEESLGGKFAISGIDAKDIQTNLTPDGLNLYLNARLEVSKQYSVSIADGATDRYGQPLGAYSFSFTTGARPTSVTMAIPGNVTTYSDSAEPVLYFHATNSDSASFTLYPLTPAEIRPMQSSAYYYEDPRAPFVPSHKALYTWTEDAFGAKDEVVLKSTSLSRSRAPLPRGDYLVRQGDPSRGTPMFFSVVDSALVTKVSWNELLVWALDLDTGRPLANVTVAEYGSGLEPGATSRATTGARGLASFPLEPIDPAKYPAQNRAFVVAVEGSDRKGVGSTNWQRGSYLYSQNLPTEPYPRKYVANVYTERPIYKPGEEMPYKAIVRLDDDADYSIPADLPDVFLVITDPQQKQIFRTPVVLNEFGSFAGSINLPADAPTGDYGIQVIGGAGAPYSRPLAGSSFLVAEFRKPEFLVTASTVNPSYVAGDDIHTQVEATYFFGGPLEGAAVTWSATSNSYAPRFKGFERFSFTDNDASRTAVFKAPLRSEGNAIIDARGVASFSIPAVISGNEGAQQYQIGATVADDSAQAVAASTSVIVYPAAAFVGVGPAQYVSTTGKPASLDLVTLDTDGKLLPGREVSVQVYNRTWVTTKEATAEGARRYVSQPRDVLLTTLSATTGADAKGSVTYIPTVSGSLRILAEVRDEQGRIERSSTYLYVSGGEYASWQVTNDDTIKLIADRSEYNVGDTAEVLVPAPFQGAIGLVTVERGKIITREVQQFPTNSERLQIPIVDHDVPDVFVSTILYRPPTNEDPVPRYKVGYVELPVSTATRVLNVKITPDREQAQPGDTVHYDVKVTDSKGRGVRSEVAVAVVDKALLSLTQERGLNGLKAFWFERGLGVSTASSLAVSVNRANDVIAEPTSGGKGSDGVGDERLRQDFRNTALWQAQLATDDRGNAGFDVKMPDNLTTWHTQVRAISGDILVGEGTNELVSTQPLLLRSALPRFLRVGDKPMLRALVRNATKAPTEITVTLDAEGVELGAAREKTVRVEPNSSTLVEWPATVSQEGTARLTLTARNSAGPGTGDAVKQELPVYEAITPETMATGGVVTNKPVSESVYLPAYANASQGSLTLSVQASLIKALGPQLQGFAPVSWEGSERIASRIVATLAVKSADPNAAASLTARLPSDVAALLTFQRADGGFAWCNLTCTSDPQMTAWALVALGEWRRAGNSIDSNVVNRATKYINDYVNGFTDIEHPSDVNDKAWMLYAEATASNSAAYLPNMRALFQQYRSTLNNSGRAYLLLGMSMSGLTKKDAEVRTLLDDVTAAVNANANGNHWEDPPLKSSYSLQTSPRTTALMLGALVRIDFTHPLIEETVRWLSVALTINVSRTGLERAQTIRSLAEFAAQTGELGADYSYNVKLDEDQVLGGRLKSGQDPVSEKLSLKTLELGKSHLLSLLRDFGSKGRLYYSLDLRYVTPATNIEALNRGMAVSHEYSQVDGSGGPVKLGDVLRVKVTVMLPADRNYVVVDDYLPAGLEAINPRLKTTDIKLKAQLETERQAEARSGAQD